MQRSISLFAVGSILFLSVLIPVSVRAQIHKPYVPPTFHKDTSKFWIFEDISAGPYFTGGFSRQNEDLPVAVAGVPWRPSSRFAYMIGGTADLSINKWIGLDLTALYDSRDLYLANDSENIDLSLGYIEFQPAIRIFWLLIGLAFDIPMSGSATENITAYQHLDASGHPDQPQQPYSANLNVLTGDLNVLNEVRGSLSIPILEGDDADLHLIVSGSYPLTKTLKTITPTYDTTGHFSNSFASGQGPLISLQAGISYQFDLLH